MPDSLAELLAEAGIQPKSQRPGQQPQMLCPQCGGGRTREKSLSLRIDEDGQGFSGSCHRGTCGWTSGGRVRRDEPSRRVQPVPAAARKPEPHSAAQADNRPEWLYRFFADRRIGARVVQQLGIYAAQRWFPEPIGEASAIVFPYRWRGELVNRKYRPHPHKTPQMQEKDALSTLFNVDALGDAPEQVVWVEGEPDVCAMAESSIAAVSLPNGAPSKVTQRDDDRRFAPLTTHGDLLAGVKRFVLAGDADAPGLALREELARRLGRHRCWLVTWPDGCKDACDVLREHGPDELQRCVDGAEAYPIEGIQRLKLTTLLELRQQPAPALLTTGTSLDQVVKFPGEGRLIVITGIPNHGKSVLAAWVMVRLMERHERRFFVFSPEMEPWPEFCGHCASIRIGRPLRSGPAMAEMTDEELIEATKWLMPRLTMLVADPAGDAPTVEWFLDRAAASVLRAGVTDVVIDPWGDLEHPDEGQSETKYISRSLQQLRNFAKAHGCNVWIIAHPRVQRPAKPGEKLQPPGLYEISGSAAWANKADVGLTVHTPGEVTEVHVGKARFRRWGRRGQRALLAFDAVTGRYSEPGATAESEPAQHWAGA